MMQPGPVTYEVLDTYKVDKIKVSVLQFELPLNYGNPKKKTISVVIKVVNKWKASLAREFDIEQEVMDNKENLLLFLQGGPGFATPMPTSANDPSFLKPLLDRGFTVILLDQRGTGLSTPIDAESLVEKGDVESQLEYVINFRADSIVFDAESIRLTLCEQAHWTLLGQSFGGFTSVSYMSMYPSSLKQVLLTGGLPPIGIREVAEVYERTYERTRERNIAYYSAYPGDTARVWSIVKYLAENKVSLPNGGQLSVNRFRHLGLLFGASGGTLLIHQLVIQLFTEINQRGTLSFTTKRDVQDYLGFESNVLYFLFQEAIYCNGEGISSNWAAYRQAPTDFKEVYPCDDNSMFLFTGEMVYPDMTIDYKELSKLQELAERVHSYTQWSPLYNLNKLKSVRRAQLPVAAAVYLDDQYVDYELSKANKRYFEYESYVTNALFHNGLRAASDEVLAKLFDLIDDGSFK